MKETDLESINKSITRIYVNIKRLECVIDYYERTEHYELILSKLSRLHVILKTIRLQYPLLENQGHDTYKLN